MRRLLPSAALSVPRFTANSIARWGRRGTVKRLADHFEERPAEGAVLSVLLRWPNTTMTPDDVAGYASLAPGDVDRALAELVGIGLVEETSLVGTRFYHLTRKGRLRDELTELQEWHRAWQRQAGLLFGKEGSIAD